MAKEMPRGFLSLDISRHSEHFNFWGLPPPTAMSWKMLIYLCRGSFFSSETYLTFSWEVTENDRPKMNARQTLSLSWRQSFSENNTKFGWGDHARLFCVKHSFFFFFLFFFLAVPDFHSISQRSVVCVLLVQEARMLKSTEIRSRFISNYSLTPGFFTLMFKWHFKRWNHQIWQAVWFFQTLQLRHFVQSVS